MSDTEELSDVEVDDVEEKEEVKIDLTNPDVVTKYQCAALIANRALKHVVDNAAKPDIKVVDLCQMGDDFIAAECAKVYAKGKVVKGIAFPTSVSANHLAGHFSPLASDKSTLSPGDVTKVDLGVHIDGFAALVAHTLVIPDAAEEKAKITGRKADAMMACWTAMQCALRLMVPGQTNSEVTKYFQKSGEAFGCTPLQGVLSHEMKQFLIDGTSVILGKADPDMGIKVDEVEFQANQVYAIDIVMSTGDGKTRELDDATTVFKREVDNNYSLKMKASRFILKEINSRFPTFPFTLRAFDDKRAKLGIVECTNHELVTPYPVLYERDGEYVAQLKFTVLLMPSGTLKITGLDVDTSLIASERAVEDEELIALLKQPIKRKSRRRKKKKSKK